MQQSSAILQLQVSSTSSMHSTEISPNDSAASLAEWQPEPQAPGAVFYGLGEEGTGTWQL